MDAAPATSVAEVRVAAAISGGGEELRSAALKALIDGVLAHQRAGQLAAPDLAVSNGKHE